MLVRVDKIITTKFEVTIDSAGLCGPSLVLELCDGGGGDVSIRTTVVESTGDIDSQVVLVTREMAEVFVAAWPALLAALEADRG